jgi:hypothetical protein
MFEKGHPPTPGAGRPKGSRNKLAARFFEMLLKVIEEPATSKGENMCKGEAAMRILYREKPADFLKLVASVLPAEIQFETPLTNMSTEEVFAGLEKLRRELQEPALIEAKPLEQPSEWHKRSVHDGEPVN